MSRQRVGLFVCSVINIWVFRVCLTSPRIAASQSAEEVFPIISVRALVKFASFLVVNFHIHIYIAVRVYPKICAVLVGMFVS